MRRMRWAGTGTVLVAAAVVGGFAAHAAPQAPPDSTTPIKHVVVIFGENESFDHYFGTYPSATNADGTTFTPVGLGNKTPDNLDTAGVRVGNPTSAQPRRLGPADAVTCDHSH